MKSRYDNEMELQFVSKSRNEAFARITVAAFAAQLDPTIEELADDILDDIKHLNGRNYVKLFGKCPICIDCPDECPIDK